MQKYNIFVLRRKKAKGLQRNIFFIWASRRGLGGDAFKRRKRTFTDQRRETLASPAAPSGFPLQCFLPSVPYVRMIIRTHNPLSASVISSKIGKKHFHFNPSRTPVRNSIPFRCELTNPLALTFFPRREHRVRTFSQKKWEHRPHPATDMQPLTRFEGKSAHFLNTNHKSQVSSLKSQITTLSPPTAAAASPDT